MITKEQVKKFVKEHKEEIIYATFVGLTGSVIYCIGWNDCKRNATKFVEEAFKIDYPCKIDGLTLADFGKVGETIVSTYDQYDFSTEVKNWIINVE